MSLSIDHIVITVKNIKKSINFYSNILGMKSKEFYSSFDNTNRQSLHFGNQKINLHEALKSFQPHAKNPLPGSIDICFISNINVNDWKKVFDKNQIKIEDGPVKKTGATGPIISIYIRDPDENLIEISNILNN